MIAELRAADLKVTAEAKERDPTAGQKNLAAAAADRTPTRFMSRISRRISNVEFKREVFAVFGQILIGKINHPTARVRIIQKLRELKYEAGCGFLHETDNSPMPDRPMLARIDLMIRTEIYLTRHEYRRREAQDECHLFLFPGWELVLLGLINKGEDILEVRLGEWERRWRGAGDRVRWEGARKTRMMAGKDAPIGQALGDGAGGCDAFHRRLRRMVARFLRR